MRGMTTSVFLLKARKLRRDETRRDEKKAVSALFVTDASPCLQSRENTLTSAALTRRARPRADSILHLLLKPRTLTVISENSPQRLYSL